MLQNRKPYPALKWLLLIAAILPGIAVLNQPFLRGYDDFWVTEYNPILKNGWAYVPKLFTEEKLYFGHMQLAYISIAFDNLLFGENPAGYRLVNALIHGLNALLVYKIALRLLKGRKGPALLAAFVFVVHPTVVESVAWLIQRNGLLAQLFSLSAIAVYLNCPFWNSAAAREPDAGASQAQAGPSLPRACFAACLLLLAQYSKTIAVGLAPAFIGFELWLFAGKMPALQGVAQASSLPDTGAIPKRLLRAALMMIPCAVGVWLGLTSHAEQSIAHIGGDSLAGRISGTLHLHGRAWGLMCFPFFLSTFYHVSPNIPAFSAAAGFMLAIPVAILSLFRALKLQVKLALVLLLWIAGTLGPPMNPFTGISFLLQDRYVYLALPPFCILLALMLDALTTRDEISGVQERGRKLCVAIPAFFLFPLSVFLVLLLAAASARRSLVWQDERSVFSDACESQPRCSFGHAYLASYLLDRSKYAVEAGEREELRALSFQHHALALKCDDFDRLVYPLLYLNEMTQLYAGQGDMPRARELALRVLNGRPERLAERGAKAAAACFLARDALAAKQFELAQAYASLGLRSDAKHAGLRVLRVDALQAAGNLSEARAELQILLEDKALAAQVASDAEIAPRLKTLSTELLPAHE